MFAQKIEELNASKGTSFDSDAILSNFYTRIYTGVKPKTDEQEFKAVRSELLQLLEKLCNDKDGAIEALNAI